MSEDLIVVQLPPYRGKYLKRSPKATFVLDKNVGVYRFGQEKRSYSDVTIGYPDPIMNLACEIAEKFGETPNHCIVICYSDGKEHHIPWHSDKQEGTDKQEEPKTSVRIRTFTISLSSRMKMAQKKIASFKLPTLKILKPKLMVTEMLVSMCNGDET